MYPHWTSHDLNLSGSTFHYTRTGDGSRPALLLAHGFSDSGLCWLPVARDLENDYDVILPDARGHGLSARVSAGEDIDPARDLADLITALGLKRPVIGGHSMGASTCAQVAARFPGLARAVILEDPAWFEPQPPQDPPAAPQPNPFTDFLMRLSVHTVDELIAGCHVQNPTWPEAELRPWAESKKQFDPNILNMPHHDPTPWREIVQAIHCPTLLITAEPGKGGIVTPAIALEACDLNPYIRSVQVSGVGHNIRRENYPEFMAAVRSFLQEIPA
jgi:N-formylmaleamate deformylase